MFNNQNQYSQQPLFPVDQLMTNPVQFSAQNVPFVVNPVGPSQVTLQYAPYLIAEIINHIQINLNNQSLSPLNVYIFNRASQNGFNNPFLQTISTAAVYYLSLMGNQNQIDNNNLQSAISGIAQMFVEIYSSVAVYEDPALSNYIPGGLRQWVDQQYQRYNQTKTNLNTYIQQLHNQGQQQQWQTFNNGYYGQQPVQPQFQQSMMNQPAASRFSQTTTTMNSTISSIFSNSSNTAGQAPQQTEAISNRFTNTPPAFKQPEVPVQQKDMTMENASPEVIQPAEDNADVDKQKQLKLIRQWQPSAVSLDYPAYKPSTQTLEVTLIDGKTKLFVGNKMNFEEHNVPNISSNFGGKKVIETPSDIDLVNASILKSIGESSNTEDVFSTEDEITKFGLKSNLSFDNEVIEIVSSTEEAVFKTRLSGKESKTQSVFFNRTLNLCEPIVTEDDNQNKLIDVIFTDSDTFIDLRNNLVRSTLNTTLKLRLNRLLTKAVNRMIKMNLSIPNLNIDSFVDDYQDLLDNIRKRFGDLFINAIKANEKGIIKSLNSQQSENSIKNINGLYTEDETTQISYISYLVNVTTLDINGNDLDIELAKLNASLISQSDLPEMHALLKSIFDNLAQRELTVARVLLETKDGYLLEATKGFFTADAYQLTMVEK